MAFGTRAELDPVREIAFGSISGAYATVGGPLTSHARIIRFSNSTDTDMYISDDGINNKIRLSSNGFILLDFSSNKIRDDGLFKAIDTQFYVKQAAGAPTKGAVWIEVVFATGGV
jgi:hypothetical protein